MKAYINVCNGLTESEAIVVKGNLHVAGIGNVTENIDYKGRKTEHSIRVYENTGFKMEYLLEKILSLGYNSAKIITE